LGLASQSVEAAKTVKADRRSFDVRLLSLFGSLKVINRVFRVGNHLLRSLMNTIEAER
jgi:hypothetical protein